MMWSADEIVTYWFGQDTPDRIPPEDVRRRWFKEDKKLDREIRRRFMSSLLMAAEGGLDYWLPKPEGYLALILMLDQFTRHIYRNTPMAYDYDRHARKVCYEGLKAGADVPLSPVKRAFFYMPLKHSERIADQKESLELHRQLLAGCEAGREADVVRGFVDVAEDYYLIVKRFNRFPQRNSVLKRGSRGEEIEFLDQRANSFRA